MNPKIYKPEERVSQEVIDKLREDEDYFEQILPNGAEGFIGDVAIITHPDYEYGYSYLMDRSGNKPLLGDTAKLPWMNFSDSAKNA